VEDDNPRAEFGAAHVDVSISHENSPTKLSSRAYSIALAPQLIYTDSDLLRTLVSSKVYRQLEFLAMGNWWIYTNKKLVKVPTSREDVAFSGSDIDIRSKRLVMKVLRFLIDYEDQLEIWEAYREQPFVDFLKGYFKLTPLLIDLFLGLTCSLKKTEDTTTEYALPRVSRHLRSIGKLGAGFSSVLPKWGGLSEIAQVGCRAGAVGGAVYMLGASISKIEGPDNAGRKTITLGSGDIVRSPIVLQSEVGKKEDDRIYRSVSIVSSTFNALFPSPIEGSPPPAGSVVVFPAGSLGENSQTVYIIVHTSETGECPIGQCKFSTIFSTAL
jgi:RAB protein geranylgeranyltransferase component A